jgi:hypothetical protein
MLADRGRSSTFRSSLATSTGLDLGMDDWTEGTRGSIRTPFKRHRYRPKLSRWQKKVNRAHARIRAIGERANATLKPGNS